jgi:hypothetical protein
MDNRIDIAQWGEKPSALKHTRKIPSENNLSTNGNQHHREDDEGTMHERRIHHVRRVHGPMMLATCRKTGNTWATATSIVKSCRGKNEKNVGRM